MGRGVFIRAEELGVAVEPQGESPPVFRGQLDVVVVCPQVIEQFRGSRAKPGGGLFVLHDPFGDQPRLENLLADSVVQNGRLQGQKLDSGTFLSPELSFDGQTILFAYSEAAAWVSASDGRTSANALVAAATADGTVRFTLMTASEARRRMGG